MADDPKALIRKLLERATSRVWKPSRIDLICEAQFGYEKQRIDFRP